MTTSMYFSTERIQVVQGKFQKGKLVVQKVFSEPLPEGTLINGVITNEAAISRSLISLIEVAGLKKQFIDLVVDSSSILTKRLCVPILSQHKLLELAEGEFDEVAENYEELLFDYGVIEQKNPEGAGGIILCTAMESTFAFSYIDIFNKLKLRLHSIDIAASAVIGMARFIPEFEGKTFIISVLEGNTMVSSLFVKGQYYFTNRTRLLSARGTEESTTEISKAISSLVQFNSSQKTGEEITEIHFCGLSNEEGELATELKNIYNIEVDSLPDFPIISVLPNVDYHLSDNFYVTGNLLIKDGLYHG